MRIATTLQQGRARLGVVDGADWLDIGPDLRAALEAGTDLAAAATIGVLANPIMAEAV